MLVSRRRMTSSMGRAIASRGKSRGVGGELRGFPARMKNSHQNQRGKEAARHELEAVLLHHHTHLLRERRPAPGHRVLYDIADVQARYRRAAGYNVRFSHPGMDEHGQKVAEAAEKHGMTPQEWCDSQAPHFHELWEELEISNDDFIAPPSRARSAPCSTCGSACRRPATSTRAATMLVCVPDEHFFTETQVDKADEARGTKGEHLCPDCDRPLERVKEESWFFKLSAFQDKLLALYDEHPDFVQPDFRMNEVRSFVEGGLNDLSVSRTSFDWGIEVPFDDEHVTYVWFDALTNYMTAVGYGAEDDEAAADFAYRWPLRLTSWVRTSFASTA